MFSFLNQKNIQQIIYNNCFLIFPKLLYKIQTYPSYRNFVHESHDIWKIAKEVIWPVSHLIHVDRGPLLFHGTITI